MQCSIVKKSECSRYDLGHMLFSPEFFLSDKLICWNLIQKKSKKSVSDLFIHVKETVNEINENAICYDLTDGLPKFFDTGTQISTIISTKKIAKENDFAISRMRSYLEEMGIVEAKNILQLFSTEFLFFRAKTEQISGCALFSLCMTNIVQTILKRGQYGTEQPRFYDFLLTNLPIPNSLFSINLKITRIVKEALKIRKLSRDIYAHSQYLLLSELGLADWQAKRRFWSIKNYSDIKEAERMDADYFQPKYDEIVSAIKKYSGGGDTLGNLVAIKKCVEVGSNEYLNEGIPFVRVSNISPFEISKEKYISDELYEEYKEHQPKQGEILLSKDATPGIAYYIKAIPEKMIPSGGILRLATKNNKINNEYLTLVLNSLLVGEQVKRDVGGSVILHWRPDQVKNVLIPILPLHKQNQIRQKITESFNLREKSKHLLECAKRAVEIAIEKDEKKALSWLERQTKEI